MKIITAIFIIIFLMCACSSQQKSVTFPYDSYQYRSYSFLGELVGEGSFYIKKSDSNMVTGNWSVRQVRPCLNCGKQFGSGYLEGYIINDSMIVNLNPNETEIDTKLIGVIKDGEFNGDWRWTNQQGFGFSGTFTAIKL